MRAGKFGHAHLILFHTVQWMAPFLSTTKVSAKPRHCDIQQILWLILFLDRNSTAVNVCITALILAPIISSKNSQESYLHINPVGFISTSELSMALHTNMLVSLRPPVIFPGETKRFCVLQYWFKKCLCPRQRMYCMGNILMIELGFWVFQRLALGPLDVWGGPVYSEKTVCLPAVDRGVTAVYNYPFLHNQPPCSAKAKPSTFGFSCCCCCRSALPFVRISLHA